MRKLFFPLLLLVISLYSCKFRPFLKYYRSDKQTHMPTFNKWDRFVGTSSNPLRAYDVTCYDWSVNVDPIKEQIASTMKIYFEMEANQDTLLLDLESNFKLGTITSTAPLKKVKRKKDVLFIIFKKELKKGDNAMLEINYSGKPIALLGHSVLYWKKDKNGNPWICTTTEGTGPHQLFPCKNLLYDESDSCFIRVTAPKELMVVANGKLDSKTDHETTSTFNYSVHNPINIYNISFNIGKYVKLQKPYTDINNVNRIIEVYALDYNKTKADSFYNQAPIVMKQFERIYGAFPWWNDGCRFLESNLSDGSMEHQSCISMADGYDLDFKEFNTTLIHELAHEWWGNNITGFDYADAWLHEGFATYSEALFIEAQYGHHKYEEYLNRQIWWVGNKRPVLKTYDVTYKPWISGEDGDIYSKGALFINTLRVALDDDPLFFDILKTAQQQFAKSNITTAQFMAFFNEKTKKDFTPYFNLYLKEHLPPVLEYKIDQTNPDFNRLEYRWSSNLPEGVNMNMIVSCDQTYTLNPTTNFQSIQFPKDQKFFFEVAQSGYYMLRNVTVQK